MGRWEGGSRRDLSIHGQALSKNSDGQLVYAHSESGHCADLVVINRRVLAVQKTAKSRALKKWECVVVERGFQQRGKERERKRKKKRKTGGIYFAPRKSIVSSQHIALRTLDLRGDFLTRPTNGSTPCTPRTLRPIHWSKRPSPLVTRTSSSECANRKT